MERFDTDYYDQIIIKFLSENASDEEIVILQNWIRASSQNHAYYLKVKNLWEATKKPIPISNEEKDEAIKSIFSRASKPSVRKNRDLLYRIAATIILPVAALGLSLYVLLNRNDSDKQITYTEISTPFGCRTMVKLCDSSIVWLNSGSRLTYPDRFDKNNRIILLTGEALFEVRSDPSSPFIVETSEIKVVATGTMFNVKESTLNNTTEITLAEGNVSIYKPTHDTDDQLLCGLHPNQHMTYNHSDGSQSIHTEEAYPYYSWKDGKLIFRNKSLKSVADELSGFFNVDIEIKGKEVEELTIRGTFENESLNEILKLLKVIAPIGYKEIDRYQLSDGNFSKRKIIIFSKTTDISDY